MAQDGTVIMVFQIRGLKPAHDRKMNFFIKRLNMGMEGVFIPFSEEIIVAMNDDVFDYPVECQMDGIKKAYEAAGYIDVKVMETESDFKAVKVIGEFHGKT